jgi:hypothetical protein
MPWKTDEVIECNEAPWEDNIPYGRSEVTLTKFSVEIAKVFNYQIVNYSPAPPVHVPQAIKHTRSKISQGFTTQHSIVTPL